MTRLRWLLLLVVVALCAAPARESQGDTRLKKAFRRPDQNGWIFVHLEGSPAEIGFQHGYLLAPEIADADKVIVLGLHARSKKDYGILPRGGRESAVAARRTAVPRGAEGHRRGTQGARACKLDLWDVVALNAWLELSPYYNNWYDQAHRTARCSGRSPIIAARSSPPAATPRTAAW